MRAPKLFELEAVHAISRRGSFRAAAEDLKTSPTAVGNAVAALEEELGVRLFDRTTRRVDLTPAGHDLVRNIAPALSDIQAAMSAARGRKTELSGALRINCSIAGGHHILPFVDAFTRRYPQVTVDLVTEGRLVDVVRAGFDAGVRVEGTVPPGMVIVPLNRSLRQVVVGAPSYFETHARPEHPAELAAHDCIRIRWPSGAPYAWEFVNHGQEVSVDVPGALGLDNHGLIAKAALAGMGLAYVAESEVADQIADGRLIVVLEDWMPANSGFCLYYPERRHGFELVRRLAEVVEAMA